MAQALAFRPAAPQAADESRAITITSPPGTPVRLERVLGRYDLRHEGVVTAAFLPGGGGRNMVSLGARGELLLWDAVARTLVRALPACAAKPPEAAVLAISADGRLAAQGDAAGGVCVRDLGTGRVVQSFEAHAAPVRALAFTRGGELVSYGYRPQQIAVENKMSKILEGNESGGEIRRWRPETAQRLGEVMVGLIDAMAVAADGARMFVAASGQLRGLDAAGKPRWDKPCRACKTIALLPGEKRLLVVESRRVRLVDTSDGSDEGDFAPTGYLTDEARWSDFLAVAPDGAEAITELAGSGLLFFWDVRERREIKRVSENTYGVQSAAYSADGTLVATAARGRVLLWDAGRRVPLPDSSAYGPGVRAMCLAPDGKRLVTGRDDGTVRVQDVATGAELARWPASQIISTVFSPDGRRILISEGRGTTRLVDAASGDVVWSVTERAPYAPSQLSPDGNHVVTIGANDGLTLHEAATGKRLWNFKRHTYGERVLAFTPDGRHVLSQDQDLRLGLWAADDGRYLRRVGDRPGLWNVALAPDGQRAVTAGVGLHVVNVQTGANLRTLEKDWNGPIALTREGGAVITGEPDGSVRMRRLPEGQELGRIDLGPSRDRARALSLSADGARLFVGTERGVVLVFDIAAVAAAAAPPPPPPPPPVPPAVLPPAGIGR